MRKLGVRVVSAALAVCMMASVLPVGAFAAGEDNIDSGISAGTENEQPIPARKVIETGGTYVMSGKYSGRIIISAPNQDVTIKLTDNVTSDEAGFVLEVQKVKNLTIEAGNYTVNDNGRFLLVTPRENGVTGKLTIKGGTYYVNNGIEIMACSSDFKAELYDAIITAVNSVLSNNSGGTVTVSGGKYTTTGSSPVFVNGNYSNLILQDDTSTKLEMSNEGGSYGIRNALGTVTVNSGTFKTSNIAVVTEASSTTYIYGGTFEADDRALSSSGVLVIGKDDQTDHTTPKIVNKSGKDGAVTNTNGGQLTINGGSITTDSGDGAGVVTIGGTSTTTINGGVIEGCNGGIVLQSGNPTVTVKKVTLDGNKHDIVLGNDQIITLDGNYTGTPSIRAFDPENNRQLTNGSSTGELPESHNPGYSVILENGNYYLHMNALHKLTFDHATAKASDGKEDADGNEILTELTSRNEVAAGTKVYLTADPAADNTQEFDQWVVKDKDGNKIEDLDGILDVTADGEATLTMPDYEVTVEATYKTKTNTLTFTDATATVKDKNNDDKSLNSNDEVAVGTDVSMKADVPAGEEFTGWTIKVNGQDVTDDLLGDRKDLDEISFPMPDGKVEVTANHKPTTEPVGPDDPEIPDTGDDGSGVAGAIVAGGAIIWGAYEAGTGIYRLVHMPGIILPSNRAELALLIWEKADKPAPESDELFADIDEDDTDLQQAARWMVEQDLMKEDEENNKFVPGAPVTKLQVCMTWQKAEDKGLID